VGFGGPIALAGHMQQDLVDDRDWIRKEDYLEGLALAQLAPGPLAAQLGICLGCTARACSERQVVAGGLDATLCVKKRVREKPRSR
jgi:chromate transport protein ChrA